MKRSVLAVLVLMLVAAVSVAWAGDKETFIEKCGSCHHKGGQAAPINPADKAGVVWEKYFERGRHPVDLSGTLTAAELQQVVGYLKAHAADSDQPEAALIPK